MAVVVLTYKTVKHFMSSVRPRKTPQQSSWRPGGGKVLQVPLCKHPLLASLVPFITQLPPELNTPRLFFIVVPGSSTVEQPRQSSYLFIDQMTNAGQSERGHLSHAGCLFTDDSLCIQCLGCGVFCRFQWFLPLQFFSFLFLLLSLPFNTVKIDLTVAFNLVVFCIA